MLNLGMTRRKAKRAKNIRFYRRYSTRYIPYGAAYSFIVWVKVLPEHIVIVDQMKVCRVFPKSIFTPSAGGKILPDFDKAVIEDEGMTLQLGEQYEVEMETLRKWHDYGHHII